MKLEKYKNIYFIGIGGIGMSALARWFNNKAYNIAGYDRSNSEKRIYIHEVFSVAKENTS